MRLSLISVLSLFACVVGCSTEAASTTNAGEDEVRTADCPTEFTLELDKPEISSRAPTKYYDGSPLAEGERSRVADAMTKARTFKAQSLSFKVATRAGAKCQYSSTVSTAPTAPRAELRGTAAKPLIDVTFGGYHYYAFPKSYAATGFTFESRAKAGVFAQVGASGPFSDGATLIVKIGSASITNAPPPPANTGTIADAVAELESEAVLPGPGRNDDYAVTGSTPMEMVKSYIKAKYADDEELGAGYRYQDNGTNLLADEQVAGTLSSDVALRASLDTVGTWYENMETNVGEQKAKVRAIFDKLSAAGATFGFDGFEQNACAAPTSFLLVIDAANKHVYGVDLNPCEE